jgi:hypothetical protein
MFTAVCTAWHHLTWLNLVCQFPKLRGAAIYDCNLMATLLTFALRTGVFLYPRHFWKRTASFTVVWVCWCFMCLQMNIGETFQSAKNFCQVFRWKDKKWKLTVGMFLGYKYTPVRRRWSFFFNSKNPFGEQTAVWERVYAFWCGFLRSAALEKFWLTLQYVLTDETGSRKSNMAAVKP